MFVSRFAFVVFAFFLAQADPISGAGYGGDPDLLIEPQDEATTRLVAEEVRTAMPAGQGWRFNLDVRHNDQQHELLGLHNEQEPVLNKRTLDVIKAFLLKKGQRCTYSQKFNNNPCFTTEHFKFYLNPDSGGPHQHPQWNMNCDPERGDFNTLVIRRRMLDDRDDGRNQYAYIAFINADDIRVASAFGDHPPPLQLRELAVNAVKELLASMAVERIKPS